MALLSEIFSIAFPLFLLMDPIGNVPVFLTLLKNYPPALQRKIILRELFIALVIIIAFNFIGDVLLFALKVDQHTIQISGGIILFLIAIKMIFPSTIHEPKDSALSPEKEPLVVPLATPLVAGPAVIAAVMLYSSQQPDDFITVSAIIMAWIGSAIILMSCSLLKKLLGPRGLIATERLMGLVLTLIAVQMFLEGFTAYMQRTH